MTDREQFLRNEFFSMTLMATVQRGKVYQSGLKEGEKSKFQESLRSALDRITTDYSWPVSDENHIVNIEALSREMSERHGDILTKGRFRIGSAQKALNLYLKYLWCAGLIYPPPHCPFDYQIISRLPGCGCIKWTELDRIDD